jgi:phosphoglycolate phosphatase-like HAD superfamily hydrolase
LSRIHVAFDLDGVIADTRGLVKRAYDIVGVDMPDYAWGLSWQEWLPQVIKVGGELARQTHQAKCEIYRTLCLTPGAVPPGPAFELFQILAHDKERFDVGIITNASPPAAVSVMRGMDISPTFLWASGQTNSLKSDFLRRKAPRGIYLDDMHAGKVICIAADWKFVRVWPKSTTGALYNTIKEEVNGWIPSSLPPAVTSV